MAGQSDGATLQVGDDVLIETMVDEAPLALRGTLLDLLTTTVWIGASERSYPPRFALLPQGHPIRLSIPRARGVLVADTTFLRCLAPANKLVALQRPNHPELVDRRDSLRIPLHRPIGLRVTRDSVAGDGGNFGLGMSHDICVKGIRFETTLRMAVGDHVLVSLVLEPGRAVYAMARIVRLDDPLPDPDVEVPPRLSPFDQGRKRVVAGAFFEAIGRADRERIESLVAASQVGQLSDGSPYHDPVPAASRA
jgi:hypothetical protein